MLNRATLTKKRESIEINRRIELFCQLDDMKVEHWVMGIFRMHQT